MNKAFNLFLLPVLLLLASPSCGQNQTAEVSFSISVNESVRESMSPDGRLVIYLSTSDDRQPRYGYVSSSNQAFAQNIEGWNAGETKELSSDNWSHTSTWDLNQTPEGVYFVQAVWNQYADFHATSPNSGGNLASEPVKVTIDGEQKISLELTQVLPETEVADHKLAKVFSMESPVLSDWWQQPVELKASVLLPPGYNENAEKKYPVRYNVAGYGGRYTRINRILQDSAFMAWWTSGDAPQIITVFLDGGGPFGDNYQLDSENSGPFGQALTEELIPAIEEEFNIEGSANSRFVDGCSTGGWVSLALQLFYPEVFNGCWSYSPDPVTFEHMQLVDLYNQENAFTNSAGYLIPSMRTTSGDPRFSIKGEVTWENVFGKSGTYVTSGQQWGAWNALYSPKGADGLPKAIFDPESGAIDQEVAEHWKKYDLLLYTRENWNELGPKIQGKIHVWMGDMDNFYLNNAMRQYDAFLEETANPVSDAEIVFTPMEGHCSLYSHREILEKIQARLNSLQEE